MIIDFFIYILVTLLFLDTKQQNLHCEPIKTINVCDETLVVLSCFILKDIHDKYDRQWWGTSGTYKDISSDTSFEKRGPFDAIYNKKNFMLYKLIFPADQNNDGQFSFKLIPKSDTDEKLTEIKNDWQVNFKESFVAQKHKVMRLIGDDVEMWCPQAWKFGEEKTFIWLKNGQRLISDTRISFIKYGNGFLQIVTIKNLNQRDTGVYKCYSTDPEKEAVFNLTVNIEIPLLTHILGPEISHILHHHPLKDLHENVSDIFGEAFWSIFSLPFLPPPNVTEVTPNITVEVEKPQPSYGSFIFTTIVLIILLIVICFAVFPRKLRNKISSLI